MLTSVRRALPRPRGVRVSSQETPKKSIGAEPLAVARSAPESLTRSYAACRRVVRRSGSNLCAGFIWLPAVKRRAMHALYAFMRQTDDLADNPHPAHLRLAALVEWRAALERALLGEFPPSPPVEPPLEDLAARGREILPAVADAVRRFAIPTDHLRAVIDGVEMDLTRSRYETFDDLVEYCARVASAVGLACLHVWGFRGPEAFGPARDAGVAFQLTNILRDLGEDAEQDRVYLPRADLRACDYTTEDLLAGVADARFEQLMRLEIARAEESYRRGAELFDRLEPDGRRVFGMMMSAYRAILRRIARRPADVLVRRVRLSRSEKLRIALGWALFPGRPGAAG